MRPTLFHVGGVIRWVILTRDPDTLVAKDADSTPSVAVRKNGSSTGDSVTITKRSATTGIYDCSYDPAGDAEGDQYTLEETAAVTGTTTSSQTYPYTWSIRCMAVERGTDGALQPTVAARTLNVSAAGLGAAELDSATQAQLNAIEDDSAAAVGYLTTLVSRVTSGVAAMWLQLVNMITGSGASAKYTATALENVPSGAGGETDWSDGERAQIRYRLGLDGTATAPADPDVDPIVITPATGIITTGYLVTRVKGVATAGITIRYQHAQEPAAERGSSYDDTIYSSVSNSEGIAELSLVKGGLYYVWRGTGSRPMSLSAYRVLKADGSTPDATLALPSHVGA